MSTFRKHGGLNFSSTHNIVKSHQSNVNNQTIINSLGNGKTKNDYNCHIDMNLSLIHISEPTRPY